MATLHTMSSYNDPEAGRSAPRNDQEAHVKAPSPGDNHSQHSSGNIHGAEGALSVPPVAKKRAGLHRALSARQVSMIAIAGTIGTGLFLGTGRSLAQGGPASMLICYGLVGVIVYITLLLLGEMATQYPVAGECLSVPNTDNVR